MYIDMSNNIDDQEYKKRAWALENARVVLINAYSLSENAKNAPNMVSDKFINETLIMADEFYNYAQTGKIKEITCIIYPKKEIEAKDNVVSIVK